MMQNHKGADLSCTGRIYPEGTTNLQKVPKSSHRVPKERKAKVPIYRAPPQGAGYTHQRKELQSFFKVKARGNHHAIQAKVSAKQEIAVSHLRFKNQKSLKLMCIGADLWLLDSFGEQVVRRICS